MTNEKRVKLKVAAFDRYLRLSFINKSGKLACHVVNWNTAIDSSLTLQISLEIVVLFDKIYDDEPILTVVSNIGEDVQYCCFN